MKTFVYCSMLLLSAGAAFGIVDYSKAKKNGVLEKVYSETTETEEIPAKKTETKENWTPPAIKPELTNLVQKAKKTKQKSIPQKVNTTFLKADKKEVAVTTIITPIPEETETTPIPITEKETVTPPPPPPPRELNIRDFGRGSLKQKKVKKIKGEN